MRKIILITILLFNATIVLAQKKPLELALSSHVDFFSQKNTIQHIIIDPIHSSYVPKKRGFEYPMFGIRVSVGKNLSKNIKLSLISGVSYVQNNIDEVRYNRANKNLFIIPVSLNFTYYLGSHKDAFIPFLRFEGGYNYMKTNLEIENELKQTMTGGFSYGTSIGFSINKRKYKWLSNYSFSIGYHNFYNSVESINYVLAAEKTIINYKIRRESMSFAIQYQFPYKTKQKKEKD